MRDVERLISERRAVESLTSAQLDALARVSEGDIDAAVRYWERANAGTAASGLLDVGTWGGPWE